MYTMTKGRTLTDVDKEIGKKSKSSQAVTETTSIDMTETTNDCVANFLQIDVT